MTVAASGPGDARLAVERVADDAGLAAAHALRLAVFVDEQGVPVEEEIDDLDTAETTTHVLVRDRDRGGDVVGTGRLLTDPAHPGEVHVGRVAVAAPCASSSPPRSRRSASTSGSGTPCPDPSTSTRASTTATPPRP